MTSEGKPFTDHEKLVTESYADSGKLRARYQIYDFKSGQSFPDWVFERLEAPLRRLLDVGCGPGFWMGVVAPKAELVVGTDLSHGMVAEARSVSPHVAVGDAEHLPFQKGQFDSVLCFHMLYHVADITGAVAELRRVTRPGGRTYVTTNGSDHMRRLREDFDYVVMEMAGPGTNRVVSDPSRRFRMEGAGEFLSPFFDKVQRHDLESVLEISEHEPLERYVESIRGFHEAKLPEGITWSAVTERFMVHVKQVIATEGAYNIGTHAGLFVCE